MAGAGWGRKDSSRRTVHTNRQVPEQGVHGPGRARSRGLAWTDCARHRCVIVYRLWKAVHAALDGEGARLWGGRWNSSGWPMAMRPPRCAGGAGTSRSTCRADLRRHGVADDQVPDDTAFEANADMRQSAETDTDACRQTGDAFLEAGTALGLKVRGIVSP